MPIIKVRVCYLCYQKGELKEAVGYYSPKEDEEYDVCEECKEIVEQEPNSYVVLPILEDIVEEW